MNVVEDQFRNDLRLSRDICFGVAAFVAMPGGAVRIDQSADNPAPNLVHRVELLAKDSLSHPSARSGNLFWNAKVVPDAGASDDSLACVAVGLEYDGEWLGILGVVDSWLPELDTEQRADFKLLGRSVAQLIKTAGAGGALVSQSPGVEPAVSAEPAATVSAEPVAMVEPAVSAEPAATVSAEPAATVEPVEPVRSAALEAGPALVAGGTGSFLSEVAEHLPDALVVVQDDGTIIYTNEQFSAVTGLAPDVVLGGDISTLFSGDDPLSSTTTWAEDVGSLFGTAAPGRRLSIASSADSYLAVDAWGTSMLSRTAGNCHIGLIRPTDLGQSAGPSVTDRSFAELLDALDEGILVCDAQGVVLVANRASRTLQGLPSANDLVGKPYPKVTGLLDTEGAPISESDHPLERALRGMVVQGEPFLIDRDDDRRHIVVSARPLAVEEDVAPGALLVLRDTTPQVQSEAWLTHLAMHDSLTGLANRHLFMDHLRRMLGQTGSRGGAVSIVYLDLDNFKGVNDEHGHEVGDEVLVSVARRVLGVVRPTDVVARLGGDEFVIAHTSRAGSDTVESLIARIRMSLAAPFRVHENLLAVSASVGYVSTTIDDDPLSLLVRADREMFRRKKAFRAETSSAQGQP